MLTAANLDGLASLFVFLFAFVFVLFFTKASIFLIGLELPQIFMTHIFFVCRVAENCHSPQSSWHLMSAHNNNYYKMGSEGLHNSYFTSLYAAR